MADGGRFVEHEHKFLVDASFDVEAFGRRVAALGPTETERFRVRDRYWLVEGHPGYVFRHRLGPGRQELTVKERDTGRSRRLEVTLKLAEGEDQVEAAARLLGAFGALRTFTIEKDVRLFGFADCEIVHYVARSGDHRVDCVELEAKDAATEDAAEATLVRYEERLGFDPATRSKVNLFGLLVGEP